MVYNGKSTKKKMIWGYHHVFFGTESIIEISGGLMSPWLLFVEFHHSTFGLMVLNHKNLQ